jgi:hypothetical protein
MSSNCNIFATSPLKIENEHIIEWVKVAFFFIDILQELENAFPEDI